MFRTCSIEGTLHALLAHTAHRAMGKLKVVSRSLTQARWVARTDALRRALDGVSDWQSAADLLYLEQWLLEPAPGAAAALRVKQIRRANPDLTAAICAEIDQNRPMLMTARQA